MCNISERYFEDGMEKGEKKGIKKEKTEIAKKLLAMGTISKNDIAKITGLDLKYLNELAKNTL